MISFNNGELKELTFSNDRRQPEMKQNCFYFIAHIKGFVFTSSDKKEKAQAQQRESLQYKITKICI